ncbi:ATP-binding protein [Algoriphagus pacificus]|nr:ATP-binding protein [Algoriphagus pacificus]
MLLSIFLLLATAELQASTDSLFVFSGNQGGIKDLFFRVENDSTRISFITPNSSFDKSGQLNEGDLIVGIGEGESGEMIDLIGKSEQEISNLFWGEVGTKFRLSILPIGKKPPEQPLIIEFEREKVQRRIYLDYDNVWHFSPGDDIKWADLNFDHTQWIKINPSDITEPLPDSLWNQGHGWFRAYFKADSTFYFNPWYLQLYSWGAAEVYIDGKLINRFGTFSTDPNKEVRYNPLLKEYTPIWLSPKDTHLIAVRFSYHPAKRYYEIMDDESFLLGFRLSFISQELDDIRNNQISESKLKFYLLFGIYFVVFILHGYLYYLFREQKENLLVAVLLLLLLINDYVQFYFEFTQFDRLITFFVFKIIVVVRIAVFFLLPYTLVIFFKLEKFEKLKFLPFFAPLIFLLFQVLNIDNVWPIVSPAILILNLILLLIARKRKIKGVGFITFGFIGMVLFLIIPLVFESIIDINIYDFTPPIFWDISFLTILPLSMTFLIAYKMGKMYTSLEDMVESRTEALEISLNELKSTQAQLIQSEKMASLGELTAGIAHEIQNPLNFVNNFSEVNRELISELKEEIEKGDLEEVKLIATDIEANEEKINLHGKRADAIVKGMLEHSKRGSGQKELTNLNALAEEFLRLSYQSFLAKEPEFKCELKTDLASDLPQVSVIPQDIGKVLLNLINNAFYAVNEKANSTPKDYKPEVTVKTTKTKSPLGDSRLPDGQVGVEISVQDNGSGIPDSIKEKIFQPFFTTKPTGSGTGLGLSLSYDIIKAHGGELKVESEERKGTIFIIQFTNL